MDDNSPDGTVEVALSLAKVRELPVQLGDVPNTCADISKASRLLDYSPKVRIEEGIESFIQLYRNWRH